MFAGTTRIGLREARLYASLVVDGVQNGNTKGEKYLDLCSLHNGIQGCFLQELFSIASRLILRVVDLPGCEFLGRADQC